MNRGELEQLLPHRDGMLLPDEVELTDGEARGKIVVRPEAWYLQGHFPGNPVVPGVMLCEMLAQSACVLLPPEKLMGATPYFAALREARFKNPVRPGDTLETRCRLTKSKHPYYFAEGQGFVDGKLCVSAEFCFVVVR